MNCPLCSNPSRKDGSVRKLTTGLQRTRRCDACQIRFITYTDEGGIETFVRLVKGKPTPKRTHRAQRVSLQPPAPWEDFLAMEEPPGGAWEGVEDKWGIVCEHCPLEECVRGAGEYLTNLTMQYTPGATACPIFRAVELGQTPAQLLADILQSGNDAAPPVLIARKEVVVKGVVLKGVAYQSL